MVYLLGTHTAYHQYQLISNVSRYELQLPRVQWYVMVVILGLMRVQPTLQKPDKNEMRENHSLKPFIATT